MYKNIQLVVSDLDGTLLRDELTISSRTRKAVNGLKEMGIPFVIATGRSFLGMRHYYNALELDTPAICYNGAAVFDGSSIKPMFSTPINSTLTRRLIEIGREMKLHTQFYLDERLLCETRNSDLDNYESTTKLTGEIINFDDFPGLTPAKGMYLGDPEHILKAQQRLTEEFGSSLYTAVSKPRYLELLEGGVSKGSTLSSLMKMMSIPLNSVIAFGDARNDFELLETAGTGIVMPNGHEVLKNRFRICETDNENDGVAVFLEKNILNINSDNS